MGFECGGRRKNGKCCLRRRRGTCDVDFGCAAYRLFFDISDDFCDRGKVYLKAGKRGYLVG